MQISEETIINKRVELGNKIKEARESRGLSLEKVYELTGLQLKTLRNIESGKWNYDINFIILLSIALNFDINLLLNGH